MDLDQLAKCNASDDDPSSGSLAFLVHEGIAQMAISLLPAFQHLIIKCGHLGAVVVMRAPASSDWSRERSNIHRRYVVSGRRDGELVVLGHFPPHHLPKESVVNVTGAGDTLVAGVLAALVLHPEAFKNPNALSQVIADAQLAATLTLRSPHAVSSELSNPNFS
jgi:pseudouridylate synthase / pseudouridine kinase